MDIKGLTLNFIRSYAKLIIKKISLDEIVEQAINENKVADCYANSYATNAVYYEQAKVINLHGENDKIKIGSHTHVRGELLVFPYGGQIDIGDYCYIGEYTRIWSGEHISIGNHVLIAHNVNITDFAHETNHKTRAKGFMEIITTGHPKLKGAIPTDPIVIEDHVAIYPQVNIARGVRIGRGSIISAGSVIINDVPPFTLMMGNPARQMLKLSSDEK